jgi:sodium/hydrogen antiporter
MLTFALLFLGVFILIIAWLPMLVRGIPLSLAIICVALGCLFLVLVPSFPLKPSVANGALVQTQALGLLAQTALVLALMGAGLNLDRRFSFAGWQTTWRLLGIAMPLMIVIIMLLAIYLGGFSMPSALLIAAALAPTDPVLASAVAVGPPQTGEEGEVRFGLTSEAALNDGLASPFVQLAIGLTTASFAACWQHWLLIDMAYQLIGGFACGVLTGRLFGLLAFKLPRGAFSNTGDGLIAIGITLITYALCKLAHVNGFIGVFVMAVVMRWSCPGHEFHLAMAEFSRQIERVAAMLLLFMFGEALSLGLFHDLSWRDIAIGLLLLLVVRPLSAWVSLIGSPHPALSRALTAFFGIRGIGTLYYLIYAFSQARFGEQSRIWALGAFVVASSVLIHGMTAKPAMRWADRRREMAKKGRNAKRMPA